MIATDVSTASSAARLHLADMMCAAGLFALLAAKWGSTKGKCPYGISQPHPLFLKEGRALAMTATQITGCAARAAARLPSELSSASPLPNSPLRGTWRLGPRPCVA